MQKVLLVAAAVCSLVFGYGCSATCEDGKAKMEECIEGLKLSDDAIKECEKELDGDKGEDTQKCLDCIDEKTCDEINDGKCSSDCD